MSYLYITQSQTLIDFCHQIATTSTWFAIDTEFVRTDTYYPELSLIQIQDEQGSAAIVDPLALADLTPLWALLANPDITKVFHSARQDLEVLYQVAGHLPVSIFDTQIASVFLHHGDLVGLARVIEAEFNIQLPKDQTRTNWHQRPLTEQQLEYAIDDVRYLAPLYQKLLTTLTPEQLTALNQDFESLLEPQLYETLAELAGARIKASKSLPPKAKAICFRLAEWREAYAKIHNKPRRWTLSDDALIDIAKRPPKTQQALYKVPNIKSSSVKTFGEEWVSIIDDVFLHPELWPEPSPKTPPPTLQEEVLLSLAQALSQQVAIHYGIQLNNLYNKQQLLDMIRNANQQHLIGWRHLLIEKPLQEILNNNKPMIVQNHHLML